MDTNVKKDELLGIVRGNRDRHRGVFELVILMRLEGLTPEVKR